MLKFLVIVRVWRNILQPDLAVTIKLEKVLHYFLIVWYLCNNHLWYLNDDQKNHLSGVGDRPKFLGILSESDVVKGGDNIAATATFNGKFKGYL